MEHAKEKKNNAESNKRNTKFYTPKLETSWKTKKGQEDSDKKKG